MLSVQMKNSVQRGLFHPDDIKTLGLNTSISSSSVGPGPMSAPLPGLTRKSSKSSLSSLSPLNSLGPASGGQFSAGASNHPRTGSFAGSAGRADAKNFLSQVEFDKYAEDDDEDYEDVFGKVNTTCKWFVLSSSITLSISFTSAAGQPMQTLQLNTRLSSKSWVRIVCSSKTQS